MPLTEDERLDEEELLRRGNEAKRLLEHPMIVEAFDGLEERLMFAWRNSKADDVEGREEAHRTLRVIDLVKNQLTATLETGIVTLHEKSNREQQALAKKLEDDWDPDGSPPEPES